MSLADQYENGRRKRSGNSGSLSAVRVPKTAEVVADQIRRRIIRGELEEGAALPTEAQLMENLAISRPTLREAFRILEAERLISVARGSRTGARIHRPSGESVARYAGFALQAQGTTLADIYEARLAIEPFVARRLAETKPAESAARLTIEVDRLLELIAEQEYASFLIGLAEFHRVLIELFGNRTLLLLTSMLEEIVERHQVRSLTRQTQSGTIQRRVKLSGVRSFQKLIKLIEAGDGAGAAAHWQLHLENSNKAWLDGVEDTWIIDVLD